MDKRTLYGGGVAGAVVLAVCVGGWINGRTNASPLDAPLPPGAVQFKAGEKAGATPAPLPQMQPEAVTPETAPSALPSASPSPTPTAAPTELVVFVSGAVKKPGVYHLKPGARIESAIFSAGGFKADAQTDALNLAAPAQDGDQIHVAVRTAPQTPAALRAPAASMPVRASGIITGAPASRAPISKPERGRVLGKPAASPSAVAVVASTDDAAASGDAPGTPAHHSAASNKFKSPGDGVVNLNTATAEELTRLPGVGPSTAQHILEYRQQIGKFGDISQIQDVKGIGVKKYAKMQAFLSVK